jgi:hypothetical protein
MLNRGKKERAGIYDGPGTEKANIETGSGLCVSRISRWPTLACDFGSNT